MSNRSQVDRDNRADGLRAAKRLNDPDEAVYLASRIVLLAPNPGRVEQTLAVHLDRPCDRTGPAFTEYRRQVYQAFELVAQAASDDTI